MGKITKAIGRVFQGGAKSFTRFPAAMLSALVVAAMASLLVQLDSPSNDQIFHNLQLAFALGAFLGMALAVLGLTRKFRPVLFVLANLAALLAASGVYCLLDRQAGAIPDILTARIIAAAAVSFLVFLLAIARDTDLSDYNQASFMVLKSALIALIYALVIMLGLYFVAFTIQSLLYNDLSEKVYQHIAIWSALGWFAFFLGYFPSFRRDKVDDHLATAQKHPAFIEILFAYVLIPIMSILTAVLVVWAARILVVGEWPEFEQLAAIFSAYALFGIFLWIMVSHYILPIARLYCRIFPFAAILFLAFEAYAIYKQISLTGVKSMEYTVALIGIYALLATLILIVLPVFRSQSTAWVAIILIVAAVAPFTSYQELPVSAQLFRLQMVLNRNGMLAGNQILAAPTDITAADKITITDATVFLLGNDEVAKAGWFSDALRSTSSFRQVYGFDQTYKESGTTIEEDQYTYLYLPQGFVDISDYQYAAGLSSSGSGQAVTIKGQKGIYSITISGMGNNAKPLLSVTRDGAALATQDLTPWLDALSVKYGSMYGKSAASASYEDMMFKLEGNGIKLLIVFENIDISKYASSGGKAYNVGISSIFLKED